MSKTKIKVHSAASVLERMREKLDLIRQRAYERFQTREPGSFESEIDDWLAAEREIDGLGAVTLRATDRGFEIDAALPGMDAESVRIEATADDLLITAQRNEDPPGKDGAFTFKMMRAIHFPAPIDLDHVKAEYREGHLRLKATRAVPEDGKELVTTA
ncbi:MAG: Hsp20/alpha crystallin family protein [Vicinamibacteria bacterium]